MTRRLVPFALLAVLALAACGDETGDPSDNVEGQEPIAALDGRTFVATSITDHGAPHPLVKGSELRISFKDGNLGMVAGCNQLFGSYAVDGDRLTVAGMGGTDMGCPQPLMDQDAWLSGLFTEPVTFALDGDDLTLTSGVVVLDLTDREVVSPDQPLKGTTWTLDSLITGDAVSSVPAGLKATLLIDDDGLHFDSACSSLDTAVTIDGDVIRSGDSGSGSAASECGQEQESVDRAVGRVLGSDVTWSIDEKSLTLMSGDHGLGFRAE